MISPSRRPLRRVSLNTIWLVLARVAGQGSAFILAIVVARGLGETGLGQYATVTAVVFVGNVFTTFGLDTLLIRQIARGGDTQSAPLAAALLIQLSLSGLFIVGIWGMTVGITSDKVETMVALRLYALSLLPLAFSTVFSAALRAYERMGLYFAVILMTALLQTTAVALYIWQDGGLIGVMGWLLLGQIAGAMVAGGVCYLYLPHFIIDWGQLSWPHLWQTAGWGAPFALLMVLAVVYQRLGIFLLAIWGNEAEAGWFSAAQRLVDVVKIVPYAFFGAMFPRLARQATGDWYTRRYRAAVGGLLVLAATAVGLFWWLANPLTTLLYGDGYDPAADILPVLALSLLPFILTLKGSFELVANGQEATVVKITALVLVLTAVAGFVAYNRAGLLGLCWAVVGGEVLQAGLFSINRLQKENVT